MTVTGWWPPRSGFVVWVWIFCSFSVSHSQRAVPFAGAWYIRAFLFVTGALPAAFINFQSLLLLVLRCSELSC